MSYQRRGFRGLGTCQWPQPGVPMVYPSCATDAEYQASVAPTQRAVYTGITSVYDVPGLLLPAPSTCVDALGYASADPGCVEENLRVQQENFRRTAQYNTDPAFRAQFVDSAPVISGTYSQTGPYPGAVPAAGPIVTTAAPSPAVAAPAVAPSAASSQVAGYVAAASAPVNVAGFDIPIWGLVAAGVGALFLLGRR